MGRYRFSARSRAVRDESHRRPRGVADTGAGHEGARRQAVASRHRELARPAADRRRFEVFPRRCAVLGSASPSARRRKPRSSDGAHRRRGSRFPPLQLDRLSRRSHPERRSLRALSRRQLSLRPRGVAAIQSPQIARRSAVFDSGRNGEGMTKSSPWPKLLTPLGIMLAVALLAAAGSVWWSGSGTTMVNDGGLGELIAVTQAARAEAYAAVQGDAESFESLAADRASMTSLRGAVAANEAASADARKLAADSALWQLIESNLDVVLDSRERLGELEKARAEIAELGPQLLLAATNAASALPAADLTANEPYLLRFEVMVESLQQRARGLGPTTAVADTVRRLDDAEQYIGQFVRGLRGEDATLGVISV